MDGWEGGKTPCAKGSNWVFGSQQCYDVDAIISSNLQMGKQRGGKI